MPGVVPVIFATSLLSLPQTIFLFFDSEKNTFAYRILSNTFSLSSTIGVVLYGVLIVVFTYLYSLVQVEPERLADNLTKQDAYIPSIWLGEHTAFLALFIYPVIAYTQFRINENQTTIGAIDKEPERLAFFYRKRCKRCQKVLCGKCLEVK